jgi:hypothetical protein
VGNMAHLDFAGDLSLLGDWCVHGSRGSMERTEMVIRPEKEEEEAKEETEVRG